MSDWELMGPLRRQLMDEEEYAIELEMLRLQQLHFASKPMASQSCFSYSMDGLRMPEGSLSFL